MDFNIVAWVYLGMIIGFIAGYVTCLILGGSKIEDLQSENKHLIFVRESLKEEIFRLDNQTKPQPRKRRNLKVKSLKVGD